MVLKKTSGRETPTLPEQCHMIANMKKTKDKKKKFQRLLLNSENNKTCHSPAKRHSSAITATRPSPLIWLVTLANDFTLEFKFTASRGRIYFLSCENYVGRTHPLRSKLSISTNSPWGETNMPGTHRGQCAPQSSLLIQGKQA